MFDYIGKLILKCIPIAIFKRKVFFIYEREWEILKTQFKNIGVLSKVEGPFIIKNPQYISIGNSFFSLYNLRIEAWDEYQGEKFYPEIIIGDNVVINTDCHIGCINKIVIGNNVLMASRIYISDHSHGNITKEALKLYPVKRPLVSKGPVIIEDNVWLGEGVCIMPGITIGVNAIIGANAVVTKDVPSNAVVAGNPAKVLKQF
ncbi:MAG: acetyltransferase [Cytophagales bacterium CG18_big_fil_WC_8_21_14_2_50_42_9]|nr:MAG: acetyltransferase [Cytophagales bacterium CG18_big_fil_WC_8_21_14_2_50_42_9]